MKIDESRIIYSKSYIIKIVSCIILLIFIAFVMSKQEGVKEDKIVQPTEQESEPEPEMELKNIVFESKTDDGKNYTIFANKAVKPENNQYQMSNILASIDFSGNILDIDANTGVYNPEMKSLIVSNQVFGKYMGHNFKATKLKIALDTKNISSSGSVVIDGEKIKIHADQLESIGDGVIIFEGNVKTYFYTDY